MSFQTTKRSNKPFKPCDLKHKGEPITSFQMIIKLANDKKSVFVNYISPIWSHDSINYLNSEITGYRNMSSSMPACWVLNMPAMSVYRMLKSKTLFTYKILPKNAD